MTQHLDKFFDRAIRVKWWITRLALICVMFSVFATIAKLFGLIDVPFAVVVWPVVGAIIAIVLSLLVGLARYFFLTRKDKPNDE